MLGYVRKAVSLIEAEPDVRTRDTAIERLRSLGLDAFGEVLLEMPTPEFPKLSVLLPAMASAEVQTQWVGSSGVGLLQQSCAFIRAMTFAYHKLSGRDPKDAAVLDYGCGFGRLARLMYYFVDTSNLVGLDPWDQAIELCRSAGLGPQFLQSDYLPRELPVSRHFDLAYAFSVFTHTSERALVTALNAIRRAMVPGGILCLTIRPVEYWTLPHVEVADKEALLRKHEETGFAFSPHHRPPIDGEITYGDASMSLDWLDRHADGWSRVGIDSNLCDPFQIIVFLQAI
jgi:SAM-dependent methyltransferase